MDKLVEQTEADRVFALEAADELDRLGKVSQSVADSVPAIVTSERMEQHKALYAAEARRWFRLANAVRTLAALQSPSPSAEAMREAAAVCAARELENCVRRQRERPEESKRHATAGASAVCILHEIKQLPIEGGSSAAGEVNAERIHELIEEGDGFWRSCTGCHELNEGHPTGRFSKAFDCHLGLGCRECGGIGAIWDDTDYDAMAREMLAVDKAPSRGGWFRRILAAIRALPASGLAVGGEG